MKPMIYLLTALLLITSSGAFAVNDKDDEQIKDIDKRIELLENDVRNLRAKAMETKLESYQLMINDWEKYSLTMKKVERYYSMADRIERHIDELKEEKHRLQEEERQDS